MAIVSLTTAEAVDQVRELVIGLPIDTPEQRLADWEVENAEVLGVLTARSHGQQALRLSVRGGRPVVRFAIEETSSAFPDWVFAASGGRHETPSTELVALIADVAPTSIPPAERVERIVRHVEERFAYGVRDVGLGDEAEAMPALECDIHLGTCVDTHSYAVAAVRAAGLEAAYVTGLFLPEGAVHARPGHCWFVVRAPDTPHHWDISHHLKYGLGPTTPAFNPKPGYRYALGAGRDLTFDGPDGPLMFSRLSGFCAFGGSCEGVATTAAVTARVAPG